MYACTGHRAHLNTIMVRVELRKPREVVSPSSGGYERSAGKLCERKVQEERNKGRCRNKGI